MKKIILVFSIVCQSAFVVAQLSSDKDPFLVKSFSGESVTDIKAETSGGNITLAAVSTTETRVEVYIRSGKWNEQLSKEEIQKRLDEDYELTISLSGNKISAIAKSKHRNMNWKRGLSISFKIFIPKNVSSNLSTSGGNISMSGVTGKQDFVTSGGNLTVEQVNGKIKGTTSGGNISVENSSDDMEFTTSGGNIKARNCTGKLKLSTSGGSLELNDLSGTVEARTNGGNITGQNITGSLSSNTSGGNIRFDGLSCSLEASTSGGSIVVGIKELGKNIRITNHGGNVDIELPKGKGLDLDLSAEKITTSQLENFTGTTDKGRIKGTTNGGGIPVIIKSNSGKISFTLK